MFSILSFFIIIQWRKQMEKCMEHKKPIGIVESKGFELEAAGNFTENLATLFRLHLQQEQI